MRFLEAGHIVVKGDTLYSIAKRYGTTVAKLQTLNPKVDAHSLQIVGQ